MTNEAGKPSRRTASVRGGYSSSSKHFTKLAPPPRGPAPGASSSTSKSSGQK